MSTDEQDKRTKRRKGGLGVALISGGMVALILYAPDMLTQMTETTSLMEEPMRSVMVAGYSIAAAWGVIVVLTRGSKWAFYLTAVAAFYVLGVAVFAIYGTAGG